MTDPDNIMAKAVIKYGNMVIIMANFLTKSGNIFKIRANMAVKYGNTFDIRANMVILKANMITNLSANTVASFTPVDLTVLLI